MINGETNKNIYKNATEAKKGVFSLKFRIRLLHIQRKMGRWILNEVYSGSYVHPHLQEDTTLADVDMLKVYQWKVMRRILDIQGYLLFQHVMYVPIA